MHVHTVCTRLFFPPTTGTFSPFSLFVQALLAQRHTERRLGTRLVYTSVYVYSAGDRKHEEEYIIAYNLAGNLVTITPYIPESMCYIAQSPYTRKLGYIMDPDNESGNTVCVGRAATCKL
jgi:hypothetical protein